MPVFDRIGVGHAKDVQTGKVGTSDVGAVVQAFERDHEDEDAFHCEPAAGTFQRHSFHTPVGDGAGLRVGWRVQVQEREGFGPRNGVEGVSLDGLDAISVCTPWTFGVEFGPIAQNLCLARNSMER